MNAPSLVRLVVLSALWGSSFLFMRIVAPLWGAVPTAFGRVLLGAVGLMVLVVVMRKRIAFEGKLAASLALGVVHSGVPFLMFALAARTLPAGYSAILNATTPLMAVLIGAMAFGERITPARAAGVVVGMAGVAVLAQAGPVALTTPVLLGMGACLVATACYGLAGFLTRSWITRRGGLDSRIVAMGSQWGAVLALAPFAVWEAANAPPVWLNSSPAVWAAMLALGLLCTSFAYVLYFRLIESTDPARALTVTFVIPVFALAYGVAFLGETITGWMVICGVIILLGTALSTGLLRPRRLSGR